MKIETERLIIIEMNMNMAEVVHKNSLDEDNRWFVPDEVFYTIKEASDTIAYLVEQYHTLSGLLVYAIIIKQTGENNGYVQIIPFEDKCWEIGYHIAKPYVGKGYANEAVNAFLPVITKKIGIDEVYGVCLKNNIASIQVMTKCGFTNIFDGEGNYQGELRPIIKNVWRKSWF